MASASALGVGLAGSGGEPSAGMDGVPGGPGVSRLLPFVERSVSYAQGFREAGQHLAGLQRAAAGIAPWHVRRLAVQSYLSSASASASASTAALHAPASHLPAAAAAAAPAPFFSLLYSRLPELAPGSAAVASVTEAQFRRAIVDTAAEARKRAANAATLAAAAGCLVEAKAVYDLVAQLRQAKDGFALDAMEVDALAKDAADVRGYVDLLTAHLSSLQAATASTTPAPPPPAGRLESLEEIVVDVQHRLRDLTRRIDDTKITVSNRQVALVHIRTACVNQAILNGVFSGIRGFELAYMARNMSPWALAIHTAALVGHIAAGAVAVHQAFDAKDAMARIVEHLRTLNAVRREVDDLENEFYEIQRGLRPYLRAIEA